MKSKFPHFRRCTTALLLLACGFATAQTREAPNIVMIMGDDIGYWNVSAYSLGMMMRTPNIDRIGKEGITFTDHYAEPSCTAGRAAFITGQMPIRTGLTTVGMPGASLGLDKRDPTLAELLKLRGYKTGHFGKSHLGDRDEFMPHNHGFDEFFGNLYHLNSEEEPEQRDYPKNEAYRKKYMPRGVMEAFMGQVPKDLGPLTKKRMETIDEEVLDRSLSFIQRSAKSKQPFFLWHNATRMHINTHLKPESRYLAADFSSEEDLYGSGMAEHDGHVGQLLKELDKLGLTKNTIVLYTSDNGAMSAWWPDGGTQPFRGEKASTWEGGYRVPMLVRWPAAIPAGSISNGIQTHYDLFTTLATAAGIPDVAAKVKASHRVHIDGVNNLSHWTGTQAESSRQSLIYYNERDMAAVRIGPWKGMLKQREGFFDALKPSYNFFNLRMDPFEQRDGHRSNSLAMSKAWIGGEIIDLLTAHAMTLREYPPRQLGASLRPDDASNMKGPSAAPAPASAPAAKP
jgi:arylsulfatase